VLAETANDAAAAKYDSEAALLKDPKYSSFWVPVTQVKELRQDTSDGGSTVHVEFDASASRRLKYVTADNLGVFCRNDSERAQRIIERLGGNPDTIFSLRKPTDTGKFMYPTPCSMQDAFLWYVDFNNVPRSKIIAILADYATDAGEKARLQAYATENKKAFDEDKMSLDEVLEAFPSVTVPIEHFLEFAPKMTPRYYTISSSSKVQPGAISITSSHLLGDKPRDRQFEGVCTTYLKKLAAGDRACVCVRASTFRLPKKIDTVPVIMVGPGTGLAPFRGFVQEFVHLKEKDNISVDCTLFFGCKKADQDYIYRDELQAARDAGVLTNLHTAFSRETEDKVYVQDLLKEEGERVWSLLESRKAYLYVCGATLMGRAVKDVVVSLAVTHGGMEQGEAQKYVDKLQSSGRYVQELWS
jgi:NADPH-ferrihemoprotein reductase